jgi:hypothetical protein
MRLKSRFISTLLIEIVAYRQVLTKWLRISDAMAMYVEKAVDKGVLCTRFR